MFLVKLNRWYDSLKDPWRFITAILLVLPPIILANIGLMRGSVPVVLMGFVGLLSIIGFRITAKWIERNT